jgi:hypothetical protein
MLSLAIHRPPSGSASATVPAARRSSSSHRPDPEGDDAPSVVYYGGSRSSYGESFSRYGGFHGRYGSRPFAAYGGPSRPPPGIPPYVLQHRAHVNLPPPPSRVLNAAASVASSLVESVAPLGSWQHSDVPPSSASSVTMSFVGGQGFPPLTSWGVTFTVSSRLGGRAYQPSLR